MLSGSSSGGGGTSGSSGGNGGSGHQSPRSQLHSVGRQAECSSSSTSGVGLLSVVVCGADSFVHSFARSLASKPASARARARARCLAHSLRATGAVQQPSHSIQLRLQLLLGVLVRLLTPHCVYVLDELFSVISLKRTSNWTVLALEAYFPSTNLVTSRERFFHRLPRSEPR